MGRICRRGGLALRGSGVFHAWRLGGSWSDGRFGKRLQKIEAELSAITSGTPKLEAKCKNLNLVVVGLRIFSDLASKGDAAHTAFESFRRARDASAARAAPADLSTAVEGMGLLAKSALQKRDGAPQFRDRR